MDDALQDIRTRIDEVDRRLVAALIDRLSIVRECAEHKAESNEPIRDPDREQEIVDRLSQQVEAAGLDPNLIDSLYQAIFDYSVQLQRKCRRPNPADAPSSESASDAPSPLHLRASTNGTMHRAEPAEDLSDKPYEKVSRTHRPTDTIVQVGDLAVGGDAPVLIGGPCSVESRDQVMACAEAVKNAGGHILRGGCFKPRTSPYSFQGLGSDGLDLLAEAGRTHDLPVVTEVMDPADVEIVAETADILQIGARNMQNFALLKAAGASHHPVLLKRGMMASIDEWLGAAEYILAQGNDQVMLCQRGIRTFETATRYTLDLTALPVVQERTHLPVIIDPSHASGTRRWVPPLAEGALAAGADGIMVEMHPEPDEALSDGPQSLTFDQFHRLAHRFHAMTAPVPVTAAA